MSSDDPRPAGDDRRLSALAALATVLVIPVIVVAGHFSLWMAPAAVIAAYAAFTKRDTSHGLAVLGVVALMWMAARPGSLSPWTIVVALLMFTIHTALALQTTAPPGVNLGGAIGLCWLRRSAVVLALTVLVYVAADALQGLHRSDAEVFLAAAFALLGCLVLLLRRETLEGVLPRSSHTEP